MGCGLSEISKQLLFALVLLTHLIFSVIGSSSELRGHVKRHLHDTGSSWQPNQRPIDLYSRCSRKYVHIIGSLFARTKSRERGLPPLLMLESVKFGNDGQLGLRIRSTEYNTYICFSKKGRLVIRHNGYNRRCIFIEDMTDKYTTFRSAANQRWYIGFRRNGTPMKGYQYERASSRKRRCFQFLKKQPKEKPSGRQWRGPDFNFSQLAQDLLKVKEDKT